MKSFKEFINEGIKSEFELFKTIGDLVSNVSNQNRSLAARIERCAEELERDVSDRDVQSDFNNLLSKVPSNRVNDRIVDEILEFLEGV